MKVVGLASVDQEECSNMCSYMIHTTVTVLKLLRLFRNVSVVVFCTEL